MRAHVLRRRLRLLRRARWTNVLAALLALGSLLVLDLVVLHYRPPQAMSEASPAFDLRTRNPGEALRLAVEPAEGDLLLHHAGSSALLVDAFFDLAALGARTRQLCSWIGPIPASPSSLESLAKAFDEESTAHGDPCPTSVEVYAGGRRGGSPALYVSLPLREEGTTVRSLLLRPEGFDLRVVLRATVPRGEAAGRPGCERWLVGEGWQCPEQAPLSHQAVSPAGKEVRFRFQALAASRPGDGGPFQPFGLGSGDPDSPAGLAAAALAVLPADLSAEPWLFLEGVERRPTLTVATLAVDGDDLVAAVRGSGTIQGPRAEGASLLSLLRAYPTLSLLLGALHSGMLAWMWRRWAAARGKG